MVTMKALKTFRVGSTKQVVAPGDEFQTNNAADYELRGMAIPVKGGRKQQRAAAEPIPNLAAAAGPLDSPGGTTGEDDQPPSSHRDHLQRPRRSRRFKAPDSAS